MKWFYYLNYKIYLYYKSKESGALGTTFLATTFLVILNILFIATVVDFWIPFFTDKINRYHGIILIIFIGIINYFILLHNKHYEEIFDEFDKSSLKYQKWDVSIQIYIILSIFLIFISIWLI